MPGKVLEIGIFVFQEKIGNRETIIDLPDNGFLCIGHRFFSGKAFHVKAVAADIIKIFVETIYEEFEGVYAGFSGIQIGPHSAGKTAIVFLGGDAPTGRQG